MTEIVVAFLFTSAIVDVPVQADAGAFVKAHCIRCHGTNDPAQNFRLDNAPASTEHPDFARVWAKAYERISTLEMPPADEPQPSVAERAAAMEFIAAQITEAERAAQTVKSGVVLKKLTREEYANTIYDLFGVTYEPRDAGGLPEDPSWHGFRRIGSVLSLSPTHVERYLNAAETVLREAMPLSDKPSVTIEDNSISTTQRDRILPPPDKKWLYHHWMDAARMNRGGAETSNAHEGFPDNARRLILNGGSWQGSKAAITGYNLPYTGDYLVRVKLSGLRPPGGDAPFLWVYDASTDRVLFEMDIDTKEDQPIVIERKIHFTAGYHNLTLHNATPGPPLEGGGYSQSTINPFISLKQWNSPFTRKVTDQNDVPLVPLLIVDWFDVRGPILADGRTATEEQYLPTANRPDDAQTQQILSRFGERAFRRPVSKAELQPYWEVVNRSLKSGQSYQVALRSAFTAMLCAKDFLFLVEGKVGSKGSSLDDWQLASRLSYFLWSSAPDEELLEMARSGRLQNREVRAEQALRMLNDPRNKRFAEGFAREWLQLSDVGKFPPDKQLYPTYDQHLEKSMVKETLACFDHTLDENRTITEFLDSDWIFVNSRLAQHYGLSGVHDMAMQKVLLKPEDHRGGLLTQASILGLTSDGSRHRPVHRGKWLLESIFDAPPPPPPPNAGNIPTTAAGEPKKSVRSKLESHRENVHCAACHSRIDPLGLAFDNYDAIGRYRTVEDARDGIGEAPAIDASGKLPDGSSFAGAADFKKLMASQSDRFAAAFVNKLSTYALRRGTTFSDRAAVGEVVLASKPDGYRLRSMIIELVKSDLFTKP